METHSRSTPGFVLLILFIFSLAAVMVLPQRWQAIDASSLRATYSHGVLNLSIPYHAPHAGAGTLAMEIVDPEDKVVGRSERHVTVADGDGHWQEQVKLAKPLPLDDLVWHRIHFRFQYDDGKPAGWEGTDSISQIIRTPVVHVLGQQTYLAGGWAAVRVIVTDSKNQIMGEPGAVRIELQAPGKNSVLYAGETNRRGTTEARFRFPAGLVGNYQLHYTVDTPIGSSELTQAVRLEDKVSILLTTEKPIYQPGQAIHIRALALDRSDHQASRQQKLTFEVEDSRGNKVFKKAAHTDDFGVAAAEFGLADEVNLGTYHLRALMGESDSPTNTAELAFNVERYVLPKFKVAVDCGAPGTQRKHGYQPGDHVTGTVRANYFFGKPVDGGEVSIKASAMDVTVNEVASATGKTGADGSYHFDLRLPDYFAGKPLSHGAARVLIEASVKDAAGHTETRGEPITVSESPLLITAIPEGGTLAPHLDNQLFILTAYPDGTPAKSEVSLHLADGPDQHVSTDEGGVAVARLRPGTGYEKLEIEASDQEGNHASNKLRLPTREGEDQVLLRAERAVYRTGERIHLKVFSSKARGAAYIDVIKEGQTVETRDLDLTDGQAEFSLAATPDMSGTVDLNAYLFGRDARPVADHRLIFVQPADELKIEAVADAPVYKPGAEARIRFRVTNAHGEAVHAALGLQVVDEAVFALAEKQPGFAKVFFYLEQEVMKPRYEIHSLSLPEVVEPSGNISPAGRAQDARALFAATELVDTNKFEGSFGQDVPMTKYQDYARRYQKRFSDQAAGLTERMNRVYEQGAKDRDLTKIFTRIKTAGGPEFRDAWGSELLMEPWPWDSTKSYWILRSAGPDQRFNTDDDLTTGLLTRRKPVEDLYGGRMDLVMEHDRGPFNGRAEITGTVKDPSGAVIPGASVQVVEVSPKGTRVELVRTARTDAQGQFSLAGLPPGEYSAKVSMPGFRVAVRKLALEPRDRAVLSAVLDIGAVSQTVEVSAAIRRAMTFDAAAAAPFAMDRLEEMQAGVVGGVPGGVLGGRIGALKAAGGGFGPGTGAGTGGGSAPAPRVRSYFPEALYINPEIITDRDGRASITIPIADSITTWRMAMIASTEHGALGTASSSLKVFQDFFVDLDLPVTLTQGDRVSIPVAAYNYSGARGNVSLKLQQDDWFDFVDDAAEKSVAVESGGVGGSQFTLEARRIGKFKLTLSARMDGQASRGDIVVREIEVIPNGREQTVVFNGRLDESVQHALNFPPNAIADASKIFVRLYPGALSQVVEGMDSLLRMPFGCFEQTSSSTYPNVLALDYMKRTKKLTPEVHAKAEGYIANGYQRLLTFEVPGGGFSWFGQAPANKILTAYGLMEFSDMSKVYDVDPKLIARTQQWLAGQQQPDGSWKPDTSFINEGATNRYNSDVERITAYLAWSLENTGYQGPAVERARQFVRDHLSGKLDAYTLAVVANFAVDAGAGNGDKDRDFTRQAIDLLLEARTEKGEQVWWTAEETGVYGGGVSASVETTGLAVQALLKWGQASGTARKALAYIVSKKDSAGTWGTTQATIMALRALLLATEKGGSDTQGELEVLLNGKSAGRLALNSDNNDLLHQFVFKAADLAPSGPNPVPAESSNEGASSRRAETVVVGGSINSVEIRFHGKGGLAYQVVGSYFIPWDRTPAGEPLSIDVTYDRTRLAQDDVATATATIKSNLDKTANMVMVDLGIPPGFDLLSEDLQDYQEKSANRRSGRLSKFSLTATQAILYFDSIANGDQVTLKYHLRAKYPIRARTFQSRVYEYYNPEVNSVARPVRLEVVRK